MTPKDQFDAHLAAALEESPIEDREFSSAVAARLRRHRQKRRAALGVAGVVSTIAIGLAVVSTPINLQSSALGSPQTIVAGLVLLTLCCLVWIATESRDVMQA